MSKQSIFEGLTPGEEREIQLKITDYLEKVDKINNYLDNLNSFSNAKHPAAVIAKVNDIKDKYEKLIAQMKSEIDTQDSVLEKFLDRIRRNCGKAIGYYKLVGKMWSIQSNQKIDFYYAKTPQKVLLPPMQFVDDILRKDFKATALISNSKVFSRYASDYVVFPIDSTTYTQIDRSFIDAVETNTVYPMFDRAQLESLVDELSKDRATYSEYCSRAGISYGSKWDVGQHGGLGDQWWERHFQVLREMINEGRYPESLSKFTDLSNYLTKSSIDRIYTIEPGMPQHYMQDVLAHGSYFAIHKKYLQYLHKALDIKKDTWY